MSYFAAKMHQIRFRLGFRSRPRWGSLQRSPGPLAGFKGPTSKGRGGAGKGGGGKAGKGGEGVRGQGRDGKGWGQGREGTPAFRLHPLKIES